MLMNPYILSTVRSSSQTRMVERRHGFRHDGAGLVADVDGQSRPVADISIGGLCLRDLDRPVGDRFQLALSRAGTGPAVACDCEVAGREGTRTRLVFTRPTLPLLRLVVAHVSALTGVAPHLLKID